MVIGKEVPSSTVTWHCFQQRYSINPVNMFSTTGLGRNGHKKQPISNPQDNLGTMGFISTTCQFHTLNSVILVLITVPSLLCILHIIIMWMTPQFVAECIIWHQAIVMLIWKMTLRGRKASCFCMKLVLQVRTSCQQLNQGLMKRAF